MDISKRVRSELRIHSAESISDKLKRDESKQNARRNTKLIPFSVARRNLFISCEIQINTAVLWSVQLFCDVTFSLGLFPRRLEAALPFKS